MVMLRRISLQKVGEVTVVTFVDKKILDEVTIQEVGNELFQLVERDGCKKLLVDFGSVEFLSSAALGKLNTLDNKAKAHECSLKFCSIRPQIMEVFKITRLNQKFDIKKDGAEAMKAFGLP